MERCTIYDAGSRSFDVPEYIKDVIEYWEEVEKLSKDGFTLFDALKERWNENDYSSKSEFYHIKKLFGME